jgi:hypothetical protein
MEELENTAAAAPPPPVPHTLPHTITCASMVADIVKSMSSALNASGSSNFISFLPNLVALNAVVGARNCGDEAELATQVTLHHSLSLSLSLCEEHYLIL